MARKYEPLHYAMIAGGALDKKMQDMFIRAQNDANLEQVAVKITLEIMVAPKGQDEYGAVQYSTKISHGKKASKPFTTLVNEEGLIYADGLTPADLLQESLFSEERSNVRQNLSVTNSNPQGITPRSAVNE